MRVLRNRIKNGLTKNLMLLTAGVLLTSCFTQHTVSTCPKSEKRELAQFTGEFKSVSSDPNAPSETVTIAISGDNLRMITPSGNYSMRICQIPSEYRNAKTDSRLYAEIAEEGVDSVFHNFLIEGVKGKPSKAQEFSLRLLVTTEDYAKQAGLKTEIGDFDTVIVKNRAAQTEALFQAYLGTERDHGVSPIIGTLSR